MVSADGNSKNSRISANISVHRVSTTDISTRIFMDTCKEGSRKRTLEPPQVSAKKVKLAEENSQLGISDVLIQPPTADEWYCCNYPWPRYSSLVHHIEQTHCIYKAEECLVGHQYVCSKCNTHTRNYNELIVHFLTEHVEHYLYCLQCHAKYSEKVLTQFYAHIPECHSVERQFGANNRRISQYTANW